MKQLDFKRITVEDFKAEDRDLVSKLAYPMNSFFEQVRNAFNKSIDFNNLNQEVVAISFTTGDSGQPLNRLKIKTKVSGKINGVIAISLKILDNQSVVTTAPFINFAQNENIIDIIHISGLQNNTKYNLSLLII